MRLFVEHETRYHYTTAPRSVIETLHLTPTGCATQSIYDWHIEVSVDALLARSTDAMGNIVHTFSVDHPGEDLVIVATGTVETDEHNGVISGTLEPLPLAVFLRETERTAADEAIRKAVQTVRADGDAAPLSVAHRWNDAIATMMTCEPHTVDEGTTASDAFAARRGGCHDVTHVFIAGARQLGMPARYVSGYRYVPSTPDIENHGHAWSEVFIDDLGWVSFDPTAGQCADQHYVRVAVGLDAIGAAPVRGAAYGGEGETLSVSLRIGPAAQRGVHQAFGHTTMSQRMAPFGMSPPAGQGVKGASPQRTAE